jgi:hypothetical protein
MQLLDSRMWHLAASAVALVLAIGAPASAQPGGGGQGGPRYDSTTETTIAGTVQAVEQVAPQSTARGRGSMGGTHLQLGTAADTVDVHLGPTAYLDEQKISLAKGDTVEIVGSRVTVDGEEVVIAKSIRKGDQVWTLRDATGRPLWRGGRR